MFRLKFDEIPEEGLNLKWTEEKGTLITYLSSLSQIDFEFETPLQSEANITKAGQSVFIKGNVQAGLCLQCVRCLNKFSYPLFSEYEVTLHPLKGTSLVEEKELVGEETESVFFEGGELHLSEIACEQIFLEIPYQPRCYEACKGLCPVCGKDLNLSSCECVKEESLTGFSALQKLKMDS
jgi:uncharacterized protein